MPPCICAYCPSMDWPAALCSQAPTKTSLSFEWQKSTSLSTAKPESITGVANLGCKSALSTLRNGTEASERFPTYSDAAQVRIEGRRKNDWGKRVEKFAAVREQPCTRAGSGPDRRIRLQKAVGV